MFQPSPYERPTLAERLRSDGGRRAVGVGAALLLEALLILALLTLGRQSELAPKGREIISTFDAKETEEAPKPQDKPEPEKAERPLAQPRPQPPLPDQPAPPRPAPPPPLIQLPRDSGPTFDISQLPPEPAKPAPARPVMGPPNRASPGDTPLVGTAPNGQPLYAAQWYREPSDQEMAGYLSTAQGPGWGLIACKTVAEYRVEECVALGEYPEGSGIARAALAAAWQFRVVPPRRANRYLVGEWVRIRISLEERPAPAYARP